MPESITIEVNRENWEAEYYASVPTPEQAERTSDFDAWIDAREKALEQRGYAVMWRIDPVWIDGDASDTWRIDLSDLPSEHAADDEEQERLDAIRETVDGIMRES